jgi:hypothetical protein
MGTLHFNDASATWQRVIDIGEAISLRLGNGIKSGYRHHLG